MSKRKSALGLIMFRRLTLTHQEFMGGYRKDPLVAVRYVESAPPTIRGTTVMKIESKSWAVRWAQPDGFDHLRDDLETEEAVDDPDLFEEFYGLRGHLRAISPRRAVIIRNHALPNHQKSHREIKSRTRGRSKHLRRLLSA